MEYVSVQEIASEWNMSKRRIQILCKEGRIPEAKMIGNMWVLPKHLNKPFDARRKNPVYIEKRKVSPTYRNDLKKLLKIMYTKAEEINIPKEEQRDYVLASLSAGLIMRYVSEDSGNEIDCFRMVYHEIGNKKFIEKSCELLLFVQDYIKKHKNDRELDSIVSWAYQYSNKLQFKKKYANTQFFTERYMIEYIISQINDLNRAGKIVDPCCGGGNFLLECYEILCKEISGDKIMEHIQNVIDKLYGYDIDPDIAKVAVINIKIKTMSILHSKNQNIKLSVWNEIVPNIFVSAEECIGGAMEYERDTNKIVNRISGKKMEFIEALGNADIIITNPPFATVKGMNEDLKNFLKKKYPLANCDTCAAFLLTIYALLKEKGQCGIVTQNTWMYLKSFADFRNFIFHNYFINFLINLGSGAFCDLSGEKANVSLMVMQKRKDMAVRKNVMYMDLSEKMLEEKKSALAITEKKYSAVPFVDIGNGNLEFDFSGSRVLREIYDNMDKYSEAAVPMQGTSTGNAKELIDYFWNHFGDKEWRLVSKGGGYCRWQGLNYCVVKWGREGEYIRATKGSALRNVQYFRQTNMVYSDTGTAGLNVRIMLPDQIFVASGPGIRIKKGNLFAQLAYLNSRIATYYIRRLSPKLTIAAGYIGQLPICEKIYNSVVLEKNAKLCIELKQKFLKTRPVNIEYDDRYLRFFKDDIDLCAMNWFKYDLKNELLKLEIESQIDSYILNVMGFSETEKMIFDDSLGKCAYHIQEEKRIDVDKLDSYLDKLLDDICTVKRTKVSKSGMGNDGLLEYAARDLQINPEWLVKLIVFNSDKMIKITEKYRNLILHNEVIYLMGYNIHDGIVSESKPMSEIVSYITGKYKINIDLQQWLKKEFNIIHSSVFKNYPVIQIENDKCRKVRF